MGVLIGEKFCLLSRGKNSAQKKIIFFSLAIPFVKYIVQTVKNGRNFYSCNEFRNLKD